MKVSVVVPAFNEEKLLPRTLAAIQRARGAFADRGWDSELIVCDNNSTDRTAEIAAAGGARVIFEPVNQIGRARNRGASIADGDWLVFVDADSEPSPALFAAAAAAMASGKVLAGGATVKLSGGGWMLRLLAGGWNLISRWGRWLAGSFIFVERAAFQELGGFHPEMFAAEEIDLTRRLRPLARRRNQRMVILHRTPLETSARKAHLYSSRELLAFMLRSVLRPSATVTRREACSPWYDGRR